MKSSLKSNNKQYKEQEQECVKSSLQSNKEQFKEQGKECKKDSLSRAMQEGWLCLQSVTANLPSQRLEDGVHTHAHHRPSYVLERPETSALRIRLAFVSCGMPRFISCNASPKA
eukprot:145219-Pelagomonas_calceolata.AAC.4